MRTISSGRKSFTLSSKTGSKIDPREYAGIQVASGMIGHCKKSNLGGDVIRIPLRNFYPKALRLHNYILSEKYDLGRNISVIGVHSNSDSLVKHSGTLYSIYGYDVFAHISAVSDTACNGGSHCGQPLIQIDRNADMAAAVPLIPLEIIWKQTKVQKKNLKWSSGVSLSRMAFSKSSFESLYEDRLLLNTITTNIRLLGLVNAIQPHKDGILLSKSRRVMGGYTINDLLESHPNHYIVKSLKSLDTKLPQRWK